MPTLHRNGFRISTQRFIAGASLSCEFRRARSRFHSRQALVKRAERTGSERVGVIGSDGGGVHSNNNIKNSRH